MKEILKGVSASKGIVEGEIFVVKDNKDIFEFKSGCILVTTMTNPAYVPIMSNSVGVITDIGGITCHAAIISRELGIPCVVGTKNATKVLKNKDRIILNADEGKIYKK